MLKRNLLIYQRLEEFDFFDVDTKSNKESSSSNMMPFLHHLLETGQVLKFWKKGKYL